MSNAFSEDVLIQQSAADLLRDELGWDAVFAYDTESLGINGTLGRKSEREVILYRYFTEALKRFNPWITDQQVVEAIQRMDSHLSTASALQTNEEKYFMIRDGIPVTVKRPDGKTEEKKARVIDFNDPEANSFLAVRELKIKGDLYDRRPDLIGFVNGLPLLFVELKRNDVDVENAYNGNYRDYQDTIPRLFFYNAFFLTMGGNKTVI